LWVVLVGTLANGESITDFLRSRADLSQFLLLVQREALPHAFLSRRVTVLVPNDKAMSEYRGRRGEDLALNHFINSIVVEDEVGDRLSSLVTGSPPIWITKRSGWLYFSQARALERSIKLTSDSGEEQMVFVIDSVLEPLLTNSIRNASFNQDITAGKLLARTTLYNLGDEGWARIFYNLAKQNQRERMFDVTGKHTFFFPVDSAFERRPSSAPSGTSFISAQNSASMVIDRKYIDAKVIEAHIVPGKLLLTSLIPTPEWQTVAWQKNGVQVNVSLQPSGVREGAVMVRSNTVVGDRFHGSGMVVSRIVKGNIPVQNGIVHLIDKPLMVVARSLYDYVMQEGSTKSNRLYEFAQLVRDKGGLFGEMLLESKQGTLLAPTNEAFRKLDRRKLDYILGHQKLRNELFGLHFTRERIDSTDKRLLANGELAYSSPASWASGRVWFQFEPLQQKLTVEARGVNATALEKDIGTVNGVIHVIDTFLGIPSLTIAGKMQVDELMSYSWDLARATRLARLFEQHHPDKKITLIVPTNNGWEKVKRDFSQVFASLTSLQTPDYPKSIMLRHVIVASRAFTIEQLVEKSLRSPLRTVKTEGGDLIFTALGEITFDAYKEWFVSWGPDSKIKGKIVRPNIECTNGYIHLVDTVMMDDSPPWTVLAASEASSTVSTLLLILPLLILQQMQ